MNTTTTAAPTPKLIINGRKTNTFYKLQESVTGTSVARRAKGFSDYDICNHLVASGYCEWRQTGPRGGAQLHITPAGHQALEEIKND